MLKFLQLIKPVFAIVLPYGRGKLILVFLISLVQAIFQVIGVTSIFPFLALVANPSGFLNSDMGVMLNEWFPSLNEYSLLMAAGIFAIAMLAISNVTLFLGEIARARYVHGLGHWLKNRILSRMVSNPYKYFLSRNTGELLKKSSGDVMVFISGILSPFMDLVARSLMVLLLLAALLAINTRLTLIAAITLVIFYVTAYRLLAPLRQKISNGLKLANRGAMKQAIQTLAGIKPIKIHSAELFFLRNYGSYTAQQARLSSYMPVLSNTPRYMIEPIAFGGIVAVVLFFINSGQPLETVLPSLGVMALAGYRMLPNLQLIFGAFSGISVSRHALEEIQEELFDYSSGEISQPLVSKEHLSRIRWQQDIVLDRLRFKYEGSDKIVLKDISLSIPKNSFVAFIGETGCGKSTLVDLILGLHTPSSGSILVDGQPLDPGKMRSWRAGIGYVPQDIFLTDDTIEANIAFGIEPSSVDQKRIREVAQVAQLSDLVEKEMPNGYQTRVGERGVRLSGGQKQRIGLARALYHNPDLLILDEATSALDNETEKALMDAVHSLYGKISLIVIAHRLTTIQEADLVVKLKDGRIDMAGSFDEVVGNAGSQDR